MPKEEKNDDLLRRWEEPAFRVEPPTPPQSWVMADPSLYTSVPHLGCGGESPRGGD